MSLIPHLSLRTYLNQWHVLEPIRDHHYFEMGFGTWGGDCVWYAENAIMSLNTDSQAQKRMQGLPYTCEQLQRMSIKLHNTCGHLHVRIMQAWAWVT